MTAARVPQIFSPHRRRARWRRSIAEQRREGAADFVFRSMAEELEERLAFMNFRPGTALLSGDPTGLARKALAESAETVRTVDPLEHDEEKAIDGTFDLIASLGAIDTVNDVPGALIHLRNALSPGGIAMVSFVGAGSLANLRRALLAAEPDRPAARMHPMIDVQAGSALMQRAGFGRQVADSYPLRVRYGALDRLAEDLRSQALTNVLAAAPPPLSRAALQRAREAFLETADADGRVTEIFEVIILTGWKS